MSPGGASLARLYTPDRHGIPEMVFLKHIRPTDTHPISTGIMLQVHFQHSHTQLRLITIDSDSREWWQHCMVMNEKLVQLDCVTALYPRLR